VLLLLLLVPPALVGSWRAGGGTATAAMMMKKAHQEPPLTEAECAAEIKFFTEQLKMLDATGSNDILVDHLAQLDKANERSTIELGRRLDLCLTNNWRITDCQTKALEDQVRGGGGGGRVKNFSVSVAALSTCG
jgi:hypothetical protein